MPEHCVQATCYEQVRFRDLPALFTSLRVGSVPDGMYRYEIRMDEDSSEPCQIARHILANHYGTLLTTDPIQLPADGYLNFSGEELVFSGAPPYHGRRFSEMPPFQRPGCSGAVSHAGGRTRSVFLFIGH